MALKIYSTTTPNASFSQDSAFDSPFVLAFDGVTGGALEQRLYIRNDDVDLVYSGIQLEPIDGGENIVDNPTDGFTWKIVAGDEQPADAQWTVTDPGVSVTIPAINDISTYEPFWVRIEVPRGTPVQSFELVKLKITATEISI